eukprot:PITA_03425
MGDYWDDATVDKVAELLQEYQDLFPTKFLDLKGNIGDLGVMKITLKPDAKPIKQRPYRLNPKCNEKVRLELDKMLAVGIIEPVEESDWVSPMVVQEKNKKDEIRICVDLRKLKDACDHDPFPTSFTDEVLDNVGRQEAYSFTVGFSRYHQIKVVPKDRTIFSRVVIEAFKEFIHKFLEVYFDDWTVFGLRIGRPSQRDELPLNPQVSLQPFEKWEVDFVGPIQPPSKKTGARYIITATEYLTQWAEAQTVKDYTRAIAVKFLFEYVLTGFGCPKVLMSDHETHFLNETISALTEEFHVYHQKSMPYHPQANGMVEAFNKILENALTKVCNAQRNDWDVRV